MRIQIACLMLCCGRLFAQAADPAAGGDIFDQVSAQGATPTAVESSPAAKPVVVRWDTSDPRCTTIYTDGRARERITDNGRIIDVWAPELRNERDKRIYSVLVRVQNFRDEVVDVDPVHMGGLTDGSPHLLMDTIDADAMIASENRSRGRWAAVGAGLSGFAAGYGNNTTATVQNSDGSTSTVTVHDNAGTRQAEQDAANNRASINATSASEASIVLRRNTVAKAGGVAGRVYIFKPKGAGKKDHVGQFVDCLGNTIYVFPFVNGAIPK